MNGSNRKFDRSTKSSLSSIAAPSQKRDSLAAQLEQDPNLATSRREEKSKAFQKQMASTSAERRALLAEENVRVLELKLKEKEATIDRLESDRRWLAKQEDAERKERERERNAREAEKKEADATIRKLRSTLEELQEGHADLEESNEALNRATTHTIVTQKAQLSTVTQQLSRAEEELVVARTLAEERRRTIDELREQIEAEREKVLPERDSAEEHKWSVVREELHRQAEYLRTLESDNHKMSAELTYLRQRSESIDVLREEKRSLEQKVLVADQLRQQVGRLEAEVEAARREREDWASRAEADPQKTPSKTPVQITQALSELRLTNASLLEELGSTKASLRQREIELEDTQRTGTELVERVADLQKQIDSLQDQVVRRDQRVERAEREANFSKALLATYSAEAASRVGDDDPVLSAVHEKNATQMQHLEELVAELKSANAALEKRLDEAGTAAGRGEEDTRRALAEDRSKRALIEEELAQARKENEKQLETIDGLEQQLFELQGEVGAGRLVPPGQRVVCLRQNPDQEWLDLRQAAMDRLRSENDTLIKRVLELEANAGAADASSVGAVPSESWDAVKKEKEDLQQQLAQKEKRLLRLQQIFGSKAEEFRETVTSLLGYKINFYPNGQVKLTSVYDANAKLIFQPSAGKMKLINDGGENAPDELGQLEAFWIQQAQNIPCFLSSLTIECFQKTPEGAKVTGQVLEPEQSFDEGDSMLSQG